MDFRKIVITELKRRNMSKHRLAQLLDGKISRTHIYEWLAGKYDITAEKLAVILEVLGIKVKK